MKQKTMQETIRVGLQRNITDKNCPVESVPLSAVIMQMETSQYLKDVTEAIHVAKSKDERDQLKRKLPAIIISADTTCRKPSPDDKRTGLILVDIDGADNPDMTQAEIEQTVSEMADQYGYVIGWCMSASWNGLKVLCGVDPSISTHKRSFMALEEVFQRHGIKVDRACKDVKRVNYLCHDPNVHTTLGDRLAEWNGETVEPLPEKPKREYVHPDMSHTVGDMSPDEEASLCLKHLDPDMDYADWVAVGMAIKAHGASCGLWDAWSSSGETYKAGECERKWNGFTGSGVGFATLVKMATDANGGRNPISEAKNSRRADPVDVSVDFQDMTDDIVDSPTPIINPDNTYHMNGKFYVLDGTGQKYIPLSSDALTRQLRVLGYSPKGSDGEMSAVEKFKAHCELYNTVEAAGALAGRSIGVRGDKDVSMSYLVTRKNARIVGKKGNWDNLRSLLEAQYGEFQSTVLFSWLKRARYQLAREEFMQGHALVISGQVGGGKSLVIMNVIKPLLGQVADAYDYLCRDNQFNGDLIGAEMLLIDDKPLSRRMEDRRIFGNQIKSVVATSSDVRCHRKGQDAFTVNPLWRIVVAINDTEQDLGAMPPLGEGEEDTIGDKVIMLKCFPTELPFARDKDQFTKLKKYLADDIEAFAWWLDNEFEIPDELRTGNCRFGFDEFHHQDLLAILNQNSNERTLLSVTDLVLFGDDYRDDVMRCAVTQRRYWEGKAKDWARALMSSQSVPHRVKSTVEGELAFGDSAQKAGHKIKAVAEISQGRFEKRKTNGQQVWRIWEQLDDEGCENEPF